MQNFGCVYGIIFNVNVRRILRCVSSGGIIYLRRVCTGWLQSLTVPHGMQVGARPALVPLTVDAIPEDAHELTNLQGVFWDEWVKLNEAVARAVGRKYLNIFHKVYHLWVHSSEALPCKARRRRTFNFALKQGYLQCPLQV